MSHRRRLPRPVWTVVLIGALSPVAPAEAAGWRAGQARGDITPRESMWMSGYAARNRPSEGAVHELWCKALALEDPAGGRALLVSLDLCGIDRELSLGIREAIGSRHGLTRDRIVLACSHTHCGPVVGTNLITMYQIDDAERAKIEAYTRFLAETVAATAERALGDLEEARLAWESGRCDFAVNRRNNPEQEVPGLRARLALAGPVDHDVPVLRVTDLDGRIRAVVFGYACHCTVLDFLKFCGDYAGFAQIALEAKHPGATALFVAGCGGDQNPIPRRKLDLAEAYGNQLAAAVARVLESPMRPIEGPLQTADREIELAFGPLPTRDQIESAVQSSNFYEASRARRLLQTIEDRGKLPESYPYPVQVWRLDELAWVFLGGEVTVDYSLRIKRNVGSSRTWVSAYCNDVMAYIPSLRVLKEGGYEGASSMLYYGQPTVWSERVEEDVIAAVAGLLEAVAPRREPAAAAP